MKSNIFLILLLLFHYSAHTQNYLKAKVTDSITSEPLIGAAIIEEGTSNGGVTDENGRAQVAVSKPGAITFSVRYIGYNTRNVVVTIPQRDTLVTISLSPFGNELEEVTVTSVRTNSRIEDIPTRIEVLGLADLNEENGLKPGNIMSLLGDIAGIQMQQVSASSGNTYARIQGLNGRYTQLLKDGMPLFGGLSGSFGIMQIPPLDLKQIEIIKGSASTLYGGDAIGGIINLISKNPTNEQELTFTASQSTLLETNLNGYYAKRFNKIGLALFAGQTFQKQGDIDNDGLSDVPNVNSTVIHPKLVFYFNPKSTFTINYTGTFDTRKGGDMNDFNSPVTETLFHVKNNIQRHNGDLKWGYQLSKSGNLTVKFSGSYVDQNLDTKFYFFNATQRIFYSEVSYLHTSQKSDWVAGINVNGDAFNNQTSTLTELKDYNFQTLGAFIQNTWCPFTKLTIETGLRGDYHFEYGFFPLPRLSLMYKFPNHFTARINGGLGYKIPNLITYLNPETDLDHIAPTTVLQPELSQGINTDINYEHSFSNEFHITINQAFFFTNISKPVYDSSSAASIIALANASQGLETKGLQTYGRLDYKTWELYLGYVFTDVKKLYDAAHPELIVTPKHNFAVALFYEPSKHWRTGIESSLIAGQLDQNYLRVKNYLLLAAMVQYNIGKFSFVINCENLLDFRQSKFETIYDGTISDPQFHELWAPIDGRVINLTVRWAL